MRILQLKLTAFGPFTDTQLNLSSGQYGLHIIYGANEAGKSSSLRAITDLFYGIHARTPDNFVHPYPQLRIGGELQNRDGKVLEIVRRKATKNSLFNADDSTPLDELELTQFMGNVDSGLFQMMFGIDHERLRQGGEDIVKGEGRIGELLFAAGAGLADLQTVQTSLHQEMDALMKSSGRSGSIVTDIKSYQTQRDAVKQSQVSVETWKRHDDELRVAKSRKDLLDGMIGKDRSEQNRLKRIRDAIAVIGRWKKAKQNLAEISDTPLLADNFGKTSSDVLFDLRTAEQQQADAKANVQKLDRELAALLVPEALLLESDTIELLRDRLGGYRKARSDQPKLEHSRELAEEEAKEILRKLGRAPDLSEIEALRLPTDKTVRIQNLGNQQEGIFERVQSTRRECVKLRNEITRLEEQIAEIQTPKAVGRLRSAVAQIQKQGDVELKFQALTDEIDELRGRALITLGQLGLWQGSLEEVEKLAVPTLATIEKYAEEFKDHNGQIKLLRDRLREKSSDNERLKAQLIQLELGHRVPTEEELRIARELREEGWQLILQAWSDLDSHKSPLTSLADAYRLRVEEADQIADQLRLDADRVATKAKIQADIEQRLTDTRSIEIEMEAAEIAYRSVEQEWQEIWTPLSITPLSPLEMRAWLRKQEALVQDAAAIRSKQTKHAQLHAQIDEMLVEISTALTSVVAPAAVDGQPLRDRLRFATEKCDEMQKAENLREQRASDLESKRSDLIDAESRFADAEKELSQWQAKWAGEMSAIGLENDALPSQANSVLSNINQLFQKFQEADQFRVRLAGINRDACQFKAEVRDLVGRTLAELADKPVDDAVNLLSAALKSARIAEEKRTSLLDQRADYDEKQRDASEKVSKYKARLSAMCRQASCDNYERLVEVADRSRRRRELERSVAEFEELISGQSGGSDFKSFLAEAEAVDIDSLQPQIDTLEENIKRVGLERDEVIRQIEAERIELIKISGGSLASENAALCESIASRIEDQVRELAKLRIGAALLNAAIEEHRKKNQGPVLGRASELFRQITLGGFRELRADFNERGEPVLTGVRSSSGKAVAVASMSDGTCDQLYLALRLASLETWLDRHEPIPFIVDDVLLNFDDDRAAATLKVLAELANRTQVIFFTHHNRLVEIAETYLPRDTFFFQTLTN